MHFLRTNYATQLNWTICVKDINNTKVNAHRVNHLHREKTHACFDDSVMSRPTRCQ